MFNNNIKKTVAHACVLSPLLYIPSVQAGGRLAPNALPTGGNVTSGAASINQSGANMVVNQSTGQAIINWNSFNIGTGASVRFNQPNSASQTLNRVNSGDPSQIYRQLSANGQVFLINPSGVVFGRGAHVDVGALVASTKNLADSDFLNKNYRFSGSGAGAIVNRGSINAAPGGYVALIGAKVTNAGKINTPADAKGNGGNVVLAAGDSVHIPLDDSGLITLKVTPSSVNAKVKISKRGLVQAGGQVYMSAEAADGLAAEVLNQGKVKAPVIALNSGRNGTTKISGNGVLDASNAKGQGGTVTVQGEHISVLDNARIDASGTAGGGTVRVGGDAHGANASAYWWADATIMAPTAKIIADATQSGNGGTVVLWSKNFTNFWGSISAQGGPNDGNGGFIETSSHGELNAHGSVSAAATRGTAGLWLLDPGSISIDTSGAAGTTWAAGYSGGTYTPSTTSTILWNDITTALASNDVTVTTGSGAYDLTVAASVSYTSSHLLTLSAGQSLTVSGAITNTGAGGVTLLAAQSASGALTVNSNITTAGGTIGLFSGVTPATADYEHAVSPDTLVATGGSIYGDFAIYASLTSNGGNIAIANTPSGTGLHPRVGAVSLNAGSNGNIALTGFATGQFRDNIGLVIMPGASIQASGTGAVSLYGKSTGNGAIYNAGVWFGNTVGTTAITVSTGSGNISIVGSAASSSGSTGNFGVGQSAGTAPTLKVYSASGNVAIQGDETNAGASGVYLWGGAGTALVGWDGGSAVTTGNVSITGSSAGLTLSALQLKSNGGAVTIGDDGSALGAITLPSGMIVSGGSYKSFTIGGTNTNGVTVNTALTTNASADSAVGVKITSKSGVTIGAALDTSAASGIPVTILAAQGSAGSISDTSTITTAGGTVTLNNATTGSSNITGSGNIALGSSGSLVVNTAGTGGTLSGIVSGTGASLTKQGSGTVTLSGVNTYTGTTTVSGGTLKAGSTSAYGDNSATTVASGATLHLAGYSNSIGSLAGAGTVTDSSATAVTLTTGGLDTSTAFSGIIQNGSGTLSLTKSGAGTLTLSGANTYTGTTTVSAGTLSVGSGGTTGVLGTGAVTVDGTLLIDRSDAINLSTIASNASGIAGTGNVTVKSGGALTIDRTVSLTGASSAILLEAGKSTAAGTATGGDVTLSSGIAVPNTGTVSVFSGNANTATHLASITDTPSGSKYKTYNVNAAYAESHIQTGTISFFYRTAPTVRVTLTSTVDRTYNGTTAAAVTDGDLGISGSPIDGDSSNWTITPGYTANYDSPAAGSRTVTISGLVIGTTDTTHNITVCGYTPAAGSNGTGTISPWPGNTTYQAIVNNLPGGIVVSTISGGNHVTIASSVSGTGGGTNSIVLKEPEIRVLGGFPLLIDIQTKLPETKAIISVSGAGTSLPNGVIYDAANGVLRSQTFVQDLKLNVTVLDDKGQIRYLAVLISKLKQN